MTIFIDQKIRVSNQPGHTTDPLRGIIRVSFASVTLCLDLIESAGLAAMLQAEIRKVEAEHPNLCGPTDAERRQLRPGDRVRVRDDFGDEAEYEIRAAPWQLGHGAWVVGLCGISGGYALERVAKIVRKGVTA